MCALTCAGVGSFGCASEGGGSGGGLSGTFSGSGVTASGSGGDASDSGGDGDSGDDSDGSGSASGTGGSGSASASGTGGSASGTSGSASGTGGSASGTGGVTASGGGSDGTTADPTGGGSTDSSGGSGGSTSGGGGVRFDVGGSDETTGAVTGGTTCVENCPETCTAVDILFVIDDSNSMAPHQQDLALAAPAFADSLFASLPEGTDLHVGVTTSTFYEPGPGVGSPSSPGQGGSPVCDVRYSASYPNRDSFAQHYITPDDTTTPGWDSTRDFPGGQGRLLEIQGRRFFEATTNPTTPSQELRDWLAAAITSPGDEGSNFEMLTAGAAYPFSPLNAMHNDGFLRDEGAVLVIFVLSDEVGNSIEPVDTYVNMVAASKAGCGAAVGGDGRECVVTGGILKKCFANPGGPTDPENRIYPFLSAFSNVPQFGDIEAGGASYAQFLGGTLADVIAETCEIIPPPVG